MDAGGRATQGAVAGDIGWSDDGIVWKVSELRGDFSVRTPHLAECSDDTELDARVNDYPILLDFPIKSRLFSLYLCSSCYDKIGNIVENDCRLAKLLEEFILALTPYFPFDPIFSLQSTPTLSIYFRSIALTPYFPYFSHISSYFLVKVSG